MWLAVRKVGGGTGVNVEIRGVSTKKCTFLPFDSESSQRRRQNIQRCVSSALLLWQRITDSVKLELECFHFKIKYFYLSFLILLIQTGTTCFVVYPSSCVTVSVGWNLCAPQPLALTLLILRPFHLTSLSFLNACRSLERWGSLPPLSLLVHMTVFWCRVI